MRRAALPIAMPMLAMLAAAGAAPAARAADQVSITATYEAHLLIKVADLRTDQVATPTSFRVGARLTSLGALGVIKPATVLVQSNGAMSGDLAMPGLYQQTEKNGQKHRVVHYSAPAPVDPLTGLLRAALEPGSGSPCIGVIPVWDGHQRYDLVLSPAGSGQAKFGLVRPANCRLSFRPISGFARGPQKPNPFLRGDPAATFAYEPRANVWVMTEVSVPTILGAGRLSLTALHVDGARPVFAKPAPPPKQGSKPRRKRP